MPLYTRETRNRSGVAAALLVMVLMPLLSLWAAGCETSEGFGKDVEKLGDNIKDAAEDAKD